MLDSIKQSLLLNLKNIPGWQTSRKIVVIECDDWGSIRMPSAEAYRLMQQEGIPLDNGHFTRFDTLADKEDLERLFGVLQSVSDKLGKPAMMTLVSNVANPDFDKIRESGFKEYYLEPFTTTLQKYGRHPDTFSLWKQGIEKGIFVPELHGREHIAVQWWMQKLREGDEVVHKAFNHGFVAVRTSGLPEAVSQFRPEFYFNDTSQIPFLEQSVREGAEMFTSLFGYRPTAFVPSNDIFHPMLEPAFAKTGIPFLYAGHRRLNYNKDGTVSRSRHTFGQESPLGFRYYMRNCAFEPAAKGYQGIALTLSQIRAAFRWHKPALISSHRVNFVGGIDPANREKGLTELKLLLHGIVKEWPEVEFMSSRELLSLVRSRE
jgi:hypothetical protein